MTEPSTPAFAEIHGEVVHVEGDVLAHHLVLHLLRVATDGGPHDVGVREGEVHARGERPAGAAHPGPLSCPDHEEHERLRGKRLDEPPGVEERLGGMEQPQEHEEREEIEHRTDGPHVQHEITDEPHVPASRAGHVGTVHAVARNRDLRHVVEEVVQQDLRRQHRQKRQEHRRDRHAEHVAEVRARAHQQVLHHVARGTPALQDPADRKSTRLNSSHRT